MRRVQVDGVKRAPLVHAVVGDHVGGQSVGATIDDVPDGKGERLGQGPDTATTW
jgi:hypothetical protein